MAFEWIKGLFSNKNTAPPQEVKVKDFLDNDVDTATAGMELYIFRLAFWSIVRKIGAALAAVEWETYRRGNSVKAREYWAWNYSPNPNQSRTEFMMQLVAELYINQEALIVETKEGYRYVAEAYTETKSLSGNIYSDIITDGQSIPGTFASSDVFRITIEGDKIRSLLISLSAAEGELLKSATTDYINSTGSKGILKIDETMDARDDFEEKYTELVNVKFKKYFGAKNAVLPLEPGFDFTESQAQKGSSKASITGSRDIRNMMDDIIELTAQAFGVPVSIVTGKNVSDSDFKHFMSVIVQPLVMMVQTEINRKLYGRTLVIAGTYIVANMAGVTYTNLFDVANPIDKLIGSGAFCINDIRLRLGMDAIDEDWANQHWMTKNYSSVEDLLTGIDGENEEVAPVQPIKEGKNEQLTDETGE